MHMIRGHLIYVSTNIILTLGRFFEFFNPPEILVGTYVYTVHINTYAGMLCFFAKP